MMVKIVSNQLSLRTAGSGDMKNITAEIQTVLNKTGLKNGTVTVFVIGSTAGLTTIEYEPGLKKDLNDAFERVAPRSEYYEHSQRWGDDNGHSHVRASLLGPSLNVPFSQGTLELGTWQQIVLVDFDTHPRQREVILKFIGE
jgi:secondary thiamine-phosphate synthase enzyme